MSPVPRFSVSSDFRCKYMDTVAVIDFETTGKSPVMGDRALAVFLGFA
jgi:hypothetical protein